MTQEDLKQLTKEQTAQAQEYLKELKDIITKHPKMFEKHPTMKAAKAKMEELELNMKPEILITENNEERIDYFCEFPLDVVKVYKNKELIDKMFLPSPEDNVEYNSSEYEVGVQYSINIALSGSKFYKKIELPVNQKYHIVKYKLVVKNLSF